MRGEKNKRPGKVLLALTLAFVLLLTSVAVAVEVFAEESLKTTDFANGIVVEKPEPKAPITEDAKEEDTELELGGEIVGVPVGRRSDRKLTINTVCYCAQVLSGTGVETFRFGSWKFNKRWIRSIVHVTLKGEDGIVKYTVEADVSPPTDTRGATWQVDLPANVKVAKGDTVIAYQAYPANPGQIPRIIRPEISVRAVVPEPVKTDVRDPRKLTAKDKEAIDAAIRTAYPVYGGRGGQCTLPNGTNDKDGVPAVIQIDNSGNVNIFSGNDVAGDWDPNNDNKFVPEKNDDGSYKVNENVESKITFQGKDLLKNIKPDAPSLTLSEDKKNITITPNEKDTDASMVEVTYTGKDGSTKTTTATKGDSGWTIDGDGAVDANGVITLPKNKVKGGTDVTARVTDKGGVAYDDQDPLTSDSGTLTVEETKAEKVEVRDGLDPVVVKKWVKVNFLPRTGASEKMRDTPVNKGSNYKLSEPTFPPPTTK